MPSGLLMLYSPRLLLLLQSLLLPLLPFAKSAGSNLDFYGEPFVPWAPSHTKVLDEGLQVQLVLDQISGSGLASQNKFMYGSMQVQMKVAPGNTAGTVTAFYLSSGGEDRDELDFEFLGNVSGEPYLLQTNVFTNGTGYREQRVSLWFDPTAHFHTYAISWSKQRVIFSVDGIAIRVFENNEAWGWAYVDKKPMAAFFSIWNGDDWATRGGLVKIDWTAAPFVAEYRNFSWRGACVYRGSMSDECIQSHSASTLANAHGQLSTSDVQLSTSSQLGSMLVYDYCKDVQRFPVLPLECGPSP